MVEGSLKIFVEKLKNNLSKEEIEKFLTAQGGEDRENLMMVICDTTDEKDVKLFWEFHVENLNEENLKKVLISVDKNLKTVLQYCSRISENFEFFTEIYEKYFEGQKIKEILLKFDGLPFVYDLIKFSDTKTSQTTANYLEKIFKDDKLKLRKFLTNDNNYERNIFKPYYQFQNDEFDENQKIFKKLLRSTFDKGEENLFEELIKKT
jgi:hypothetical protein